MFSNIFIECWKMGCVTSKTDINDLHPNVFEVRKALVELSSVKKQYLNQSNYCTEPIISYFNSWQSTSKN